MFLLRQRYRCSSSVLVEFLWLRSSFDFYLAIYLPYCAPALCLTPHLKLAWKSGIVMNICNIYISMTFLNKSNSILFSQCPLVMSVPGLLTILGGGNFSTLAFKFQNSSLVYNSVKAIQYILNSHSMKRLVTFCALTLLQSPGGLSWQRCRRVQRGPWVRGGLEQGRMQGQGGRTEVHLVSLGGQHLFKILS